MRAEARASGLTAADVSTIKGMLKRGDHQSDIAALFSLNSGRIAEINTGAKWPEVKAAPRDNLPPPGPYLISPRNVVRLMQHHKLFMEQLRQMQTRNTEYGLEITNAIEIGEAIEELIGGRGEQ